ncbi:hypothetical protein [Sphingomonas radiodurans]|uniref:hypothetical protein n=1 Tax=Sphingomonas radiodurans TaxID=2890321 RepID=UPI001E52E08F|nr:hypothetical protein [Sphingomonas radiodurans]WBH16376.1 hypothetical protein LLW23_16540 [Sphingomonas radiodurans]
MGTGITLPSACSGFALQGQPPAVLPATPFGQGLSFRFVLTPQVWAIGGALAVGFDGRDAQPLADPVEVALAKTLGTDAYSFSITRPTFGDKGLEYVRLGRVSGPVQGVTRQYQCALGIPTLVDDLATATAVDFRRSVLLATAQVREGAGVRAYSLGRSEITIAGDPPARRVTLSIRLIGTPSTGADVYLGTIAASAPIDPATGNFVAALTSPDRTVTGSISGRFFGPQAVEIGVAFGASVAETATAPAYSVAGGVFAVR